MANAPREDQTLDFHVRMIDGGTLSMVLTHGLVVGSRLRLGPPVGSFTFETGTGRDVLLVAGSTGLTPVKAILDQISALPEPPRARLFCGARDADGLYDRPGEDDHGIPLAHADPRALGRRRNTCVTLPKGVSPGGNSL
jgi:ferredoxin-NADP reductase